MAESDIIEDEIDFSIKTIGETVRVKVKYEQEITNTTNGAETETETETEYEVVFDSIIEYTKASSGSSEAYEWGVDNIVKTVPLATSWNDFTTVSSNGDLLTFSVTSSAGNVTFAFTISQASAGEQVNANSIKIDFRLTDFDWERDDSYVALLCSVESSREVEVEYEDETKEKLQDVVISFAEAVDTVGVVPFGEFTWVNFAQVSNTDETIDVLATSSDSDDYQRIAFSFVGAAAQSASDIYWDPQAGIGYAEAGSGTGNGSASRATFYTAEVLVSIILLMPILSMSWF
jgi:hypothetical protein